MVGVLGWGEGDALYEACERVARKSMPGGRSSWTRRPWRLRRRPRTGRKRGARPNRSGFALEKLGFAPRSPSAWRCAASSRQAASGGPRPRSICGNRSLTRAHHSTSPHLRKTLEAKRAMIGWALRGEGGAWLGYMGAGSHSIGLPGEWAARTAAVERRRLVRQPSSVGTPQGLLFRQLLERRRSRGPPHPRCEGTGGAGRD